MLLSSQRLNVDEDEQILEENFISQVLAFTCQNLLTKSENVIIHKQKTLVIRLLVSNCFISRFLY
jgi:hypothetical protein